VTSETSETSLAPKQIPKDLISLKHFLESARGQSQEDIILLFLDAVRDKSGLIEDASVLIDHPEQEKLVVFDHRFLDPRKPWENEFRYSRGTTKALAVHCYIRRRKTEYPPRTQEEKDDAAQLVGRSDIKNMVCVPIMLMNDRSPFGVACFHNSDPDKKFSEKDGETLESYVDVLALALHMPHPEIQLEQNVFIVHGRDETSLKDLEVLLLRHNVRPIILKHEERNAQSILESLELTLRKCKAGFILVTPDDEGRFKERSTLRSLFNRPFFGLTVARSKKTNEPFEFRARENVIFETGLLFSKFRQSKRVAILLQKPAVLPSDLKGILYDEFRTINDIEARITARLQSWGMTT
jgi:predicted nucleotide-binding protein